MCVLIWLDNRVAANIRLYIVYAALNVVSFVRRVFGYFMILRNCVIRVLVFLDGKTWCGSLIF